MGQFEAKNNSSSTNNYNDDNGLHHTSKYNICDFIQICLFILNRIFYRAGSFILLYLFLYFVCGLFFKLKWYPHNLIMMKYAVQWHSIHAKLAHPSSLSSVQSLSRVRLFATPWMQHTRPPCPPPSPRVHSNSHPSSQWCHPVISSSVIPFSSCPQSLPASESFSMSHLFA